MSDRDPIAATGLRTPVVRVPIRTGMLFALIAVLSLAAAGCGGSSSPGVASLSTATSSGSGGADGTSAAASPTALATCLTSHGFPASTGSAGSTGSGQELKLGGVTVSGNVDPGSPQFQSALQACHKYMPGGGPPSLTPAQRAEAVKAYTRFAGCMRKHGLPNFPDPEASSSTFFPPDSLKGIDPSSPQVQQAFNACQSLEPKTGPRLEF